MALKRSRRGAATARAGAPGERAVKTRGAVGPEQVIPHRELFEAAIGAGSMGAGSKVFHLDDVPELASAHDGRTKKILFNRTNTAAGLLVDVVTVVPGGSSPQHYHRGTEHFFVILAGRGRIEISGHNHPLQAGTIAWIADGDVHQVFADPEIPLTFLEYFSHGQHETVFLGQGCEWRPPQG